VPVGESAVEQALEDLRLWRNASAAIVPISLNVSTVQLQRTDAQAMLARLPRRYGMGTGTLRSESTDSAVFERHGRKGEPVRDAIGHLREFGTRTAIDDFGTGYSSRSDLKRWRVDALKMDCGFIHDLIKDMGELAIVDAIVAMARHLNLEVIM
jgi:EAL domain-containing protein (putative c-di-GMP-specific phosphodiesterase class I)